MTWALLVQGHVGTDSRSVLLEWFVQLMCGARLGLLAVGVLMKLSIPFVFAGVLDKAKELGTVKFAGAAPGIGTRVAVTSDPDGYGVVLVEYEDFEKELK